MRCASLRSKHAKDSSAATDIEDGFALEKVSIVDDRRAVGACPDRVLQHLLVDALIEGSVYDARKKTWGAPKWAYESA
jgi:hypothetical protein